MEEDELEVGAVGAVANLSHCHAKGTRAVVATRVKGAKGDIVASHTVIPWNSESMKGERDEEWEWLNNIFVEKKARKE